MSVPPIRLDDLVVTALCPGPDERLFVVSDSDEFSSEFKVALLDHQGQPDPAFAEGGMAKVDLGLVDVYALFITSTAYDRDDSTLFITGIIFDEDGFRPCAVRLQGNGQLDPTFNGQGFNDFAELKGSKPVILQTRGQQRSSQSHSNFLRLDDGYLFASADTGLILRLNTDGTLDHRFGGRGYIRPQSSAVSDFELQAADIGNGWLHVAGHGVRESRRVGVTMRYSLDGAADSDFADHGTALIDHTEAERLEINGLAVTGQHLDLVGSALKNGLSQAVITRLTLDGHAERGFNGGTPVLLAPEKRNYRLSHAAWVPHSGILYSAGHSTDEDGDMTDPRYFVAALTAKGALATAFNASGWLIGPKDTRAYGMFIEPPASSSEYLWLGGSIRYLPDLTIWGMVVRLALGAERD